MILITGGAGFIGSHMCVALAEAGQRFLVLDDFSNSARDVVRRIGALVGHEPLLVEGDVRDEALLDRVLSRHPIEAAIHFAGLKAVGESVREPLRYYRENIDGALALVAAMGRAGVRRLVFSSSATVYAPSSAMPLDESAPLRATNPYGWTKLMIEQMLEDVAASDPAWRIARLRYFNPVGAHESGTLGEEPQGVPNNLAPYVTQVAAGQRPRLQVFGDDYPTPDGTGVRDYIHVMDLAEGHVAALRHLEGHPGVHTFNLGTGRGTSVLELVRSFEEASGRTIPYDIVPRRAGDVGECWADPARAREVLGWTARRGIAQMCADAWRWQQHRATLPY
ncbi:MAG: UDP-glucose 4-epimerase GalE [Xylophilus ampelinus]